MSEAAEIGQIGGRLWLPGREGNGTPLQYSCLENPMDGAVRKAAVHGVAERQTWLSNFPFTFHFHALEKEMATHSIVLAWRIPGTGEPGGLPSMGSHRVGHDWSDLAAAAAVWLPGDGGLPRSTSVQFTYWLIDWCIVDLQWCVIIQLIWLLHFCKLIHLLAVPGHCRCSPAFSSCNELGLLLIVVLSFLITVVSLVEHGL